MRTLWGEIRYAFRTLARAPGFAVVAVLTLALGIGANSAIFSIVYAVLLRPLPYPEAGRLVLVMPVDTRPNGESDPGASFLDFEACRRQSRSLERVAAYFRFGLAVQTLTGTDDPEKVRAGFVSADFFPMMGVAPELGRTFTAAELERRERVVVLSRGLWQRRFGSSAAAIGGDLEIEAARWKVIGVMPAQFRFPFEDTQFWAPMTAHPQWRDNGPRGTRLMIVGRLRRDVAPGAAQAEISAIAEHIRHDYPDTHQGFSLRLIGLRESITGSARKGLLVLFAAVMLVLLIACANLANLFLARGASRVRELAVRAALGAGRARLLRQMLMESAVVSLLAGLIGLLLAAPAIGGLKAFAPADIPRLAEAGLDGGTLLFTFGASLAVGLMFGMAPAWSMSRADPNEALKAGGRSATGGPRGNRAHGALVAAEFALAVMLLTGAGLLIRSLVAVLDTDPGFRPERILSMGVSFPRAAPAARIEQFYREALVRLRAIPGVEHAAWAETIFYSSSRSGFALRQVEGRAPEPETAWKPLTWNSVRGDYFQAMGIPLRKGRYFSGRDDGRLGPPVAIVNESLARRYWPGEDPIGKRFRGFDARGRNDEWLTVVGLVGDMRSQGRDRQPMAQVYDPPYLGESTSTLLLRTTSEPLRLAASARAVLRGIDRNAVIAGIRTLEQQLKEQTAQRRFQTWLLAAFSTLALALAAVGIYGVMHYAVAGRTHEIGVRMALGARAGDVFAMVIGQGLRFALIGAAAGLLGSLWLTRSIAGMLYGVKETDPVTFVAVTGLLILVAVAACCVPARRAMAVDPMVALRYE